MNMNEKDKPSPYRGKLTVESVSKGIYTAKKNAERLLADADILIEQKSYPSACGLAVLAIEEISKPAILRKLILAITPE